MKRMKKQAESDDAPGAPEWMVTFSDCMTLLLTFFVLLLSFSSFDNRVFLDLRVIYSQALNSFSPMSQKISKDALSYIPHVRHVTKLERGSETPTSAQELKEALMEEVGFADFKGGMVFLIPSKKVFWGKGVTLSREGRNLLSLMASFLEKVPGRVVVSETGSMDAQNSQNFGLPRAWKVMEYLTTRQNVDRDRLSISMTGIFARYRPESDAEGLGRRDSERTVEITLLKRNTYN